MKETVIFFKMWVLLKTIETEALFTKTDIKKQKKC